MNKVIVQVTEMYAEKLAHWASVGRTFDTAIRLLGQASFTEESNQESAWDNIEELQELKAPLDAMNSACKQGYTGTFYILQLPITGHNALTVHGPFVSRDDRDAIAVSIITSAKRGLAIMAQHLQYMTLGEKGKMVQDVVGPDYFYKLTEMVHLPDSYAHLPED